MSKNELMREASEQSYKPEILEKVYHLLDTFEALMNVPYLEKKLVLKGGTALNLFCFDALPRLSVDIDLNYIGAIDRETMLQEKHVLKDAFFQVLQQKQFVPYRSPTRHAGGKMLWHFNSVLGQRGLLEIDINYMYRQPLWPINYQPPNIKAYSHFKAPILDFHELAAGKLSALFDRKVSRDLFDARHLLKQKTLDKEKLRLAFIVYLGMTEIDINTLGIDLVDYDLNDLRNRLFPVLHQRDLPRKISLLKPWATELLDEVKDSLKLILPLEKNEKDFIKMLRDKGEIKPDLITADLDLQNRIKIQPGLLWACKRKQ